jgi:hypothetical protein
VQSRSAISPRISSRVIVTSRARMPTARPTQ